MFCRKAIAAVALTATVVTAADVCAQQAKPESAAVRRPFRGLFGAPAGPDSPHSLLLTASVYAAYDDNVVEALSSRRLNRPWLQESGSYGGADAGLQYGFAVEKDRASFRGQLGGRLSYYYHSERSDALPSATAALAFGFQLTKSLQFELLESAAYTSNYNASLAPLPGEEFGHEIGIPAINDLDLFGLESLRTLTTASLVQRFGRYASLAGAYHFRTRDVIDSGGSDPTFHDYQSHAGSARFSYDRPMTRNATLKLGYGIRVSDRNSGTGEPQVMHNVDAGVDYSRALSFSRRTSFSFGTGSSVAVSERVDQTVGNRRVRARLIGHASLVHEIGRTWTAELNYSRAFRTREGLEDLYFTDAVTATIGGLVTRRLSLSAAAAWANSSIESTGSLGHRGTSVTGQGNYALASFLAVFARYVYYQYRYGEEVRLDDRFPRQLDRQGVRVGLTASIPLIR